MYSAFENLPVSKRENIIGCALKEFATKGFEQASTNSIVKEAGISKGILFHYFKTKKDLYKYVLFYSIDILYSKMIEKMDFKSNDYFERMLEVSAVKMEIQLTYPEIYTIVINLYKNNDHEIIKEIYERYAPLMSEYYSKLNAGIDMTKFKDNMDINRINEAVTWICEGIGNKLLKEISSKVEDMPKARQLIEDEFMIFAEILKGGIYK